MSQVLPMSLQTNVNKEKYADLHVCCCDKGQGQSGYIQGKQIGCITGYATKKSIKIVPLRGDPLPPRQPLVNCPVHGILQNENELRKRSGNMQSEPNYSFKEVIITWNDAVESAKSGSWEDAFNSLQTIKDYSAKMRFNLGQVAWVLQNTQVAKENFTAAIEKDPHMALAHFQLGMVNYHLHRYNESRNSYEKSKTCLRGNRFIDYRQLGFVHKLYECEVLYNLALTYATMMNNSEYALELLADAKKVSVEARHGPLIEKAQKQLMSNQLYEPIVLPSNQLFTPPKSKVANLKDVDYLGKAKVVSELPESSNNNNETNFQPPTKGAQQSPNSFRPIDDDFSDDDDLSPTFNGSSSPTPSMVAKMTHKDTIATWYEGVLAFEKGDYTEALNQLNGIVDPSAKILYNIGILQKSLGQLEDASSTLKEVVSRDPHLAIGHFQSGVVLGIAGNCDDAWHAFEKARETLRGKMIDYKQLGLQYKLHKCEVLHNQAWAYNELDQRDWARNQLDEARECKADPRHEKIEDSYRAFTSGRSFKLYELPKVLLFKPPKSKIDNLDRKDYLGKAKIVAKLPTVRRGSSTPPPQTSSSLGVPVLTPRSKTPTPSSAPPAKALPVPKVQNLSSPVPDRQVPSRQPRPSHPDTQVPWKMPVVTVDSLQTSSKPPSRPPPSQSGGFNPDKSLPEAPAQVSPVPQRPLPVSPGRKVSSELPPSRPLPSPTRLSPVPDKPLPVTPGKKNSSDLPPSRPLPSPTRFSPVPDRPLPEQPGKRSSPDLPPSRPLPSPSRLSPVPDRPLPQRPVPTNTSDSSQSRPPPLPNRSSPVPDRQVPLRPVPEQNGDRPPVRPLPSPKRSSPPPPERPLPGPPQRSISPDLPQRLVPQAPSNSDVPSRPLSLADRPVPPRPGTASPELPSRPLPLPPGRDEPDLPPRPAPVASRISDLSNRAVPPSPNAGRKLPGIPVPKNDSHDLSNRRVPTIPGENIENDLPSRPPPPKPTQSMPELPPRPAPSSPQRKISADSLSARPVPPPPVSNAEPELPPRPKPGSSNPIQDRPVPPPPPSSSHANLLNPERRSSSPGLPDLPPPLPPQRGPSPVPPRKQFNTNNNQVASNGGKPVGNKAKLVKIVSDSPPVVRRAAAVTVTVQKKEEKPPPSEKPKPATPNKHTPAGNQPPILAFKPDLKPRAAKGPGPGQPGKRKTALVIASRETDVEGEVSVSEGDLITITGEAGDWLEVEFKGQKGRVPRSCVKDFSKRGI
ncbi:bromodomain-containing protein 4-like isoform X2 [Lytechinus variegatus]|uniref:bromodomain-containing protein 4-like isoform X1 n=1 Tax=Lytechinus variegatus TaxID=7654 RepID=UPI001BB16C88|nr:bromodomain-containing protein 4-like isoform X1 [Lytechinus variegatus]XP_041482219.1 bromodomain-containing protein 4-like isoform X2 [Lytechinus variegatus]